MSALILKKEFSSESLWVFIKFVSRGFLVSTEISVSVGHIRNSMVGSPEQKMLEGGSDDTVTMIMIVILFLCCNTLVCCYWLFCEVCSLLSPKLQTRRLPHFCTSNLLIPNDFASPSIINLIDPLFPDESELYFGSSNSALQHFKIF